MALEELRKILKKKAVSAILSLLVFFAVSVTLSIYRGANHSEFVLLFPGVFGAFAGLIVWILTVDQCIQKAIEGKLKS